MAKARKSGKKKTVTLAHCPWDMGPDTKAARHLCIVEDASYTDPETGRKVNPNGVKRKRRISWVDLYRKKGWLTERQHKAAMALQEVYDDTQKTGAAIKKVQVDTSPSPDHAVAIMIARSSRLHSLYKHVQSQHSFYVDFVVMENRPITQMPGCSGGSAQRRYMARLAAGLECVADGMRY